MAASFSLNPAVLRRAVLGAVSLHCRTRGPTTGLRLTSTTVVPEENVGIIESTEEYKFVERLIPPSLVPDPPKHTEPTPSGWIPPAESPPDLPYMIRRSRMHNIPVYKKVTHSNRQMTVIRKVEGDIWALEKDVKEYLKTLTGYEPPTQVNEVTMALKVKGYFDAELTQWLAGKGF